MLTFLKAIVAGIVAAGGSITALTVNGTNHVNWVTAIVSSVLVGIAAFQATYWVPNSTVIPPAKPVTPVLPTVPPPASPAPGQ